MIICNNISLTSGMKDLVLSFLNGKKVEKLEWPLPPTIVLERDPETGHATKTKGPFKNGKLKADIVLKCIADAMEHYYGPQSHDAAERVEIWLSGFDKFPSKLKVNSRDFRAIIADVKCWCDRLLAFDNEFEHSIDAYLLRRSLIRTFNSWASSNQFNDKWPEDTDDETDEDTDE